MKPWENNWGVIKELGHGGQGTTFLVRSKTGAKDAVLKVLRYQDRQEARARMYQEVVNLKILYNAGGTVPNIIENNTDQFDKVDIELFFVMDYIQGETLRKIVESSKDITLENAINIVKDLAKTVKLGIAKKIVHRDLKPENIVVRSLEASDCVIVDYGLSFNSDLGSDLTETGEMLDNKFLSLPERRVPGGDRRDPRSDITGLCGLLYFIITAIRPVDLLGQNGEPPHRRRGHSIREKLGNTSSVVMLESFFDKGFSVNIDDRFQTIDDVLYRLDEILSPRGKKSAGDLITFAEGAKERLFRFNRPAQVAEYTKNANVFFTALIRHLSKLKSKITTYELGLSTGEPRINIPSNTEKIANAQLFLSINEKHNRNIIKSILYRGFLKGNEIGIFRSIRSLVEGSENQSEWENIFWFDGNQKDVDPNLVIDDLEACMQEQMQKIEDEIIKRSQ